MILGSAFIPLFSGWLPPMVRGARCMDGCYSDNLPILDENTITVSPFCGGLNFYLLCLCSFLLHLQLSNDITFLESDICPRDATANLMQV